MPSRMLREEIREALREGPLSDLLPPDPNATRVRWTEQEKQEIAARLAVKRLQRPFDALINLLRDVQRECLPSNRQRKLRNKNEVAPLLPYLKAEVEAILRFWGQREEIDRRLKSAKKALADQERVIENFTSEELDDVGRRTLLDLVTPQDLAEKYTIGEVLDAYPLPAVIGACAERVVGGLLARGEAMAAGVGQLQDYLGELATLPSTDEVGPRPVRGPKPRRSRPRLTTPKRVVVLGVDEESYQDEIRRDLPQHMQVNFVHVNGETIQPSAWGNPDHVFVYVPRVPNKHRIYLSIFAKEHNWSRSRLKGFGGEPEFMIEAIRRNLLEN